MSNPAYPPPYDMAYTHGVHAQPVRTQPQTAHVIIHSTHPQPVYSAVRYGAPVGPGSSVLVCPSCNHNVVTRIEMKPGLRTHACAICMFFVGLWPCCFLPYCIPSCNNVDHYCPNCSTYIGSYKG